jgi:hypothetical protein
VPPCPKQSIASMGIVTLIIVGHCDRNLRM